MENKKHIKDDFDLEYENLPITVYRKTHEASRYEPAEYSEDEIEVSCTYTVDDNEVMDFFAEHWESYEELQQFDDTEEGNEAFQKYIEDHIEELFEKYSDDVYEHFEDAAREYAEDNYDPSDDDYDYGDW